MTFWTDGGDDYDFEAFDKLVAQRQEAYETKRAEVESNPHPLYGVFPKNLDIIVHEAKFLPALTYQPGLTLVKSPKGSGKTAALSALISDIEKRKFPKSVKRHERAYSVLLIGHRRSLIKEAAKRLKLECYLGVDPDEPFEIASLPHPDLTQENEHYSIASWRERRKRPVIFHARRFGFAICLDSLHKLRGGPKYDAIIIDECEQVITHLLAETLQKGEGTQAAYSTLRWLCHHARSIYALDADLGQISLHAFSVLNPEFWQRDFRIIYNKPLPVAHRRQMLMYKSRTHLQNKLIEAIRNKRRCFVACNSKAMADTLTALLRTEFNEQVKIITITSDTAQQEVEAHFIQNIQSEVLNYDVLICSPSLGTGIDLTFPDQRSEIPEVFGFFSPFVNKHTDIDQQLARVRHPENVSVWFQGGFTNFECNPEVVRDHMARANYVPSALNLDLDDHGQVIYNRNNPLLNIITHVRVAQWASQNNIRALFQKLREDNGWEIIGVEPPKTQQSDMKWDAAEDRVSEERIDRVMSARPLDEIEYIELSGLKRQGKRMKIADRAALERAEIERLWQAPATPEIVRRYAGGAIIRSIKGYLVLFPQRGKPSMELQRQEECQAKDQRMVKGHPAVLAARMLASVGLTKDGVLSSRLSVDITDFGAFIELCHNNRVVIQDIFGTSLRKDFRTNPVRQFNEFLAWLGFHLEISNKRRVNGKTVQTYKSDPCFLENMEYLAKLFQTNREHLFPGRMANWDKD